MTDTPQRGWDGAGYDRVASPQARWGATVLTRLELGGDETVLDLGCGSGRVTEQLLERLPHGLVVALDASPSMLSEARNRLSWAGSRVRFVEADALALGAGDLPGLAPVDAVFSSATFHLIPDHPLLFANLAGVLRRGGQLAAQCGAEGNVSRLTAIVRRLGADTGRREYASPEVTRVRLERAGFVDVRVWASPEPTRFDSSETLRDFLEVVCLGEAVAGMTESEREQFLSSVVAAMGEPVIDYVRLNIVARRAA